MKSLVVVLLLLTSAAARADHRPHARHHRLTTSHGPIHVWLPAGYDAETAALVVYVHGYYIDVDHAWTEHHLARQFAASGLNAMFIACGAPESPDERVAWTSVTELLDTVGSALDEPLPDGPVIAVGHSAAHRTLEEWLDEDRLDTIALLDAMYGDIEPFRAWIEASDKHRLIDVGDITRASTDELHAMLPETLTFERFPARKPGARLRGARSARIVYVRSRLGHMPLITGGVALPIILRALRVPEVTG